MRWVPLAGYEETHIISTDGDVVERSTGRTLKRSSTASHGYPTVNIGGKQPCVHTLVLESFVEPRPPGMQARHFPDPTKANVRLENLSWATASVNIRDNVTNGVHNMASKDKCPQGHSYTEENTYSWRGRRHCRTCQRKHKRDYKIRKRGEREQAKLSR